MNRLKTAKKLHTEEGATLVELLAALAILSIIVTSFLAYFVQAGNTNNRTDKVNEATYIAQAEMEKVMKYDQSENLLLSDYQTHYPRPTNVNGYVVNTDVSKKTIEESGITLYNVKVIVEQGDEKLAEMETWLPLKDEDIKANEK